MLEDKIVCNSILSSGGTGGIGGNVSRGFKLEKKHAESFLSHEIKNVSEGFKSEKKHAEGSPPIPPVPPNKTILYRICLMTW